MAAIEVLYIFHGADTFTRREALAELRASLDVGGALATNTVTLRANETSAGEVMAACATPPFLGTHRLVIVEGLLKLAQDGRKRGRKSEEGDAAAAAWEPLTASLPEMPESTALVLVDGSVSRDNPLLDRLRSVAKVQPCEPPAPRALADWAQARAQKLGLKLERGAAQKLAQLVGGQEPGPDRESLDTWSLASEIDKLAAYTGGPVIRAEDVEALTPGLREQKSYFLCDAIAERRPAAAAKLLHELLIQNDPPQVILATIAGHFRRLAIAREMLDAGADTAAIGPEVGRVGYGLEKLVEQASSYSLAEIRVVYAEIVDADFVHKSGRSDEIGAIEVLVQEIASSGDQRRRSA